MFLHAYFSIIEAQLVSVYCSVSVYLVTAYLFFIYVSLGAVNYQPSMKTRLPPQLQCEDFVSRDIRHN